MATLDQYQNENRVNSGTTYLVIPGSSNTAAKPFDCFGTTPVGLVIPNNFIASNITFKVLPYSLANDNSVTNADLVDFVDETGAAFTIAATQNTYIPLSPLIFNGIRFFNLVTSSNQTITANVAIALAPLWNQKI